MSSYHMALNPIHNHLTDVSGLSSHSSYPSSYPSLWNPPPNHNSNSSLSFRHLTIRLFFHLLLVISKQSWLWVWVDAVFKYEAPNTTNPFQHIVYLFSNLWSFIKCDIKKAKRVAKATQGGGEGFKLVLNKWQPYYFACGEKNCFHCNNDLMKFVVFPMIRWSFP
ncbi:hypothetical protein AHAS_Ahas04G0103400 [Arachis hypogaea]|uniref:Phytocyanin domain-containing protein n=1 Tax=Arachis hypogaea TaxID=3818 RepID=A0A445DGU4_ARAHY|nr:hypothetical protein Ahy_A04g019990 [Arachis hypogaea]